MILLPAVDIRDGRAVRLRQGDFDDETVYADDPLEAARAWVEAGARRLHVVDLDGAREGRPVGLPQLERIAGELNVPVQYGGGLRTAGAARDALTAGAARVVVGTAAFRDPAVLEELLASDPERVAVAVDARGGKVATGGWTERTQLDAPSAIEGLVGRGVRSIAFTNVDVDGTFAGVDRTAVASASRAAGDAGLIYSGGVGSLDDLRALAAMGLSNLEGVIVGKALYERRFTVGQAIRALEPSREAEPG